MTNKNLSSATDYIYTPFLLKPAVKDYLWGGTRLIDDFSKETELYPLAETWECSTHPDGVSIIDSGMNKGMLLSDYIKQNPAAIGTHPTPKDTLPIMLKLIDADKELSVQVHPTDEYAFKYENGQLGKTELWYVLDAAPGATLVYGLNRSLTKDKLRQSIANNTIGKYLRRVPVKKDDVFFIEAGTIHAIGKGVLIAEIQECSNLTYRLYDYNRTDKNGKKRELHIDKALEVADLRASKDPIQPMRVLSYRRGFASELIARCKYFEVHRILINTEQNKDLVSFKADSSSFRALLCIGGCGSMQFGNKILNYFKGDCVFVPANSVEIKIHGKAQFLDVRA